MILNVKNHDNLIKNTKTGVVTNTNTDEINQYRIKKNQERLAKEKMDELESQIHELKHKIDHIIHMLEINTNKAG